MKRASATLSPPNLPDFENEFAAPRSPEERQIWESARICGANWPELNVARVEFWGCEIEACVWSGELERWQLTDVRATNCDFSGASCPELDARRGELVECKMLGFAAREAHFQDVVWRECRISLALLRAARFERVRFQNCDLRGADFTDSDLRGAVFEKCDLREADFSGANLRGADVSGSELEGVRVGANSLQGLIVDPMQTPFLAKSLGLDVRWK